VAAAAADYAILRAIDDPHLVRIHDVSTRPYAVFELIDADRVSDAAPLDWRRALAIVKQMCAPLHAAAERGFFSRKLSPDHVFLQSRAPSVLGGDPYRGIVEASDFVKVALGTNVGANPPRVDKAFYGYAGSLDCTSPELLGGDFGDERSYVYTLGVFAYFLITGRWPLDDVSLPMRVIPRLRPPIPVSALVPNIPQPIDNLILTCLAHDPKHRYPTTLVLRDALATFG
jgi:serine/threonine-protein kinase